jgi:hypothetical protein
MDEKQIGIKIRTSLSGASEARLTKFANNLERIQAFSKGVDMGALKQISDTSSNFEGTSKNIDNIGKSVKTAFNVVGIKAFLSTSRELVRTISNLTAKSAEFTENLNLYQVAFKEIGKSVEESTRESDKFINKLSEMYGLDESWLTRTTGTFRQLANAMKLGNQEATQLATLMTQMSIDISSLYNLDINRASSVLQSSLAGQTKPIRGATGGDITQPTLQTTLDSLGIEKAVTELSFAEKRLLIIISLTEQLNQVTNDFGKTIESPANQTRILSEQWIRLSRAVGNLFMPIVSKVLPYLNAILMVLTEIINLVAGIFGFNIEDFDYGVAEVADSVLELEEGLDGASESAKKLKSGLRGFDKLNVITTPSSGASVAGASGGIDPSIMKAFNNAFDEYNSKLKDVRMRATEIRDNIMEWLGFTKLVDKETNKVSFKFEKITGGTVLGALALGGSIFLGIKKILGFFKGISTIKGVAGGLFDNLTGKGSAKGAGSLLNDIGKAGGSASKIDFKLPSFSTVLKGIGELALIIGACTLVVSAYGGLAKIPGFKQFVADGVDVMVDTFVGIGKIILPVIAISAVSAGLGMVSSLVLPGLGSLALVILACTAIVSAFGALSLIDGFDTFISNGISVMVKTFEGIEQIILPVLAVGAVSAGLGLLSSVVIPGLGVLALVMVEATAVVSAYAGLSKIPGINEFVNGGIELMCLVFDGIGKVIGSVIGGTIEKISESIGNSLEKFGTNLSNFMINATPFFEGIKNVDASSTEAVKNIAQAILLLTTADILDGLTRWITGDKSFAKFGEELKEFAPDFKSFASEIGKLPESTISKTKIASEAMLILVDMAKKIPNSGGVAGFFAGENDLSTFSRMLRQFGKDMTSYSNNIKSMDGNVVTNSQKVKEAMGYIIEFAKKIPNDGGVAGFFAGDNNIADFGKNLRDFGKYFKEYSDKIKGISIEKVNAVTDGLKQIADVAKTIKQNGLAKTMADFGQNLKNSANNIKSFFDTAFTYNKGWDLGAKLGSGIADAVASKLKNKKFPTIKLTDTSNNSNVGSYKITAYAQGGLPPVGQLFMANEQGPELVGHIGGQSFVANQNQVVDLIDRKLSNAGGMNSATFIIQVGSKEVAREVLTDLQDMAKSDGKPITIYG